MSRAMGATDPFEAAARRATVLVGDGCVIRQADDAGGGLRAVAADHRDVHRRTHFRALLDAPPLQSEGGWIDQALERGHALRLPDLRPEALASVGIPADERVGDVIVIPAPGAGTAILAFRDRAAGRYSERERRQLEEIAALLGGCLQPREERRPAAPPDGGFDPDAHRLLDATSAALWVVDPHGRTKYVNEAASELVGLPAGQLTGVPIFELMGSAVARPRTGFYGRDPTDRRLLRADGSSTWVTVTSRPLFDDDGEESGALYTLVEVGDRRRREVEIRLRLQQTEALLEIASEACETSARGDLLGKVVSFIAEQLGVEFAAVASYDLQSEAVCPLAASDWSRFRDGDGDGEPDRDAVTSEISPGGAVSAAVRSEEPVLVGDYEGQSLYSRSPRAIEAGVRSAAVVPFAGGAMALIAESTQPGAIDGDSLSLLESLARLLEPRWTRG